MSAFGGKADLGKALWPYQADIYRRRQRWHRPGRKPIAQQPIRSQTLQALKSASDKAKALRGAKKRSSTRSARYSAL